jgi:hypothetical protein
MSATGPKQTQLAQLGQGFKEISGVVCKNSPSAILVPMHIELRRTFRELLLKEQVDDAQSLFPGHATLILP